MILLDNFNCFQLIKWSDFVEVLYTVQSYICNKWDLVYFAKRMYETGIGFERALTALNQMPCKVSKEYREATLRKIYKPEIYLDDIKAYCKKLKAYGYNLKTARKVLLLVPDCEVEAPRIYELISCIYREKVVKPRKREISFNEETLKQKRKGVESVYVPNRMVVGNLEGLP